MHIKSHQCISVCLSVCLCVYLSVIRLVHDSDRGCCPIFLTFGNYVTHDNEDQVRWPITSEVVNAHARQFTSGLAHFKLVSTIALPYFSSDFNQICYVYLLCQKKQILSVTQLEVIYAHAHNFFPFF